MEVSSLKRDSKAVLGAMSKVGNNLVANKDLLVHIPKGWAGTSLASVETLVKTVAVYGIIVGDKYATSVACCHVMMAPSSITTVTVNDTPYLEMMFSKGDTVVLGLDVLVSPSVIFPITNEIVDKGKTPWFFSKEDQCRLLDTTDYHADSSFPDRAVIEMMAASRLRLKKNRASYFKEHFKSQAEFDAATPDVIAGNSIAYGATNTTAKLLGSHMPEGMSSALVNPSERLEAVEELLLN